VNKSFIYKHTVENLLTKLKEIMYSFEPTSLIMKLSVDVKKDRRGNVRVNIKQAKKGYCHKWDCNKKAKKNYVLCKEHLKLNKLRRKK